MPEPSHPAVNWDSLLPGAEGATVEVTCSVCHVARRVPAKSVRYQLRARAFTGLCRKDGRWIPDNPSHPAVNWESLRKDPGESTVEVTCPRCMEPRRVSAKTVRYQIRKGDFTGLCPKDHTAEQEPAPNGRHIRL